MKISKYNALVRAQLDAVRAAEGMQQTILTFFLNELPYKVGDTVKIKKHYYKIEWLTVRWHDVKDTILIEIGGYQYTNGGKTLTNTFCNFRIKDPNRVTLANNIDIDE